MIFLVHLHKAKGDRYYLRLEKDGVFKNWALPQGLPKANRINLPASKIRDGNLSVASFEGSISKGLFGPGVISIWDKGSYEPTMWYRDRIVFNLHGIKSSGTYVLNRVDESGKEGWTISKIEAQIPKPAEGQSLSVRLARNIKSWGGGTVSKRT
ncbi:MAG: ATP-dependent DNA ligase [Candidatus Aureabacteria bacterium]|nr:ATP-dependent DNA ligase [Candidatus Auribacterota bacterium]